MVVQALRLGADVGLGAVIEQTGDESPDFVFGELVAGRMQLWAISRDGQPIATVITQIEGRPAVRALTLRYMAGKSFSSWAGAAHAAFMAFARETDCALIEATASRRGLGPTFKEFGWRQVAVMFQVAVE